LFIPKKAEESALIMGELPLLIPLGWTFGEINIVINIKKARITAEAAKYLFKNICST
jgi:hypothetical protein